MPIDLKFAMLKKHIKDFLVNSQKKNITNWFQNTVKD